MSEANQHVTLYDEHTT